MSDNGPLTSLFRLNALDVVFVVAVLLLLTEVEVARTGEDVAVLAFVAADEAATVVGVHHGAVAFVATRARKLCNQKGKEWWWNVFIKTN